MNLTTNKRKRRWLQRCDLKAAAPSMLFEPEQLQTEKIRRWLKATREYAQKHDGNKAPNGFRKKYKRGCKLERIP